MELFKVEPLETEPPERQSTGMESNGEPPAVLEALTQYYDPSLRCFTFKDFQMAPILEEYERLLGLPLGDALHYFHRGQSPFWTLVAKLLGVTKVEIAREKQNRNGLKGIPRVYQE
ncbi:hypothetical protein CR513_57787, partial [Mucuna pruriens]